MSVEATSQISGGCHCGEIQFKAQGPVHHLTHCHCTICRAFGGTLVSWMTVDQSRFCITKGSPKLYRSSPNGRREFCECCGAHLTFRHRDERKTIDIAIGTLENPEKFAPNNQIWWCERLPFLSEINYLPMSSGDSIAVDESSLSHREH